MRYFSILTSTLLMVAFSVAAFASSDADNTSRFRNLRIAIVGGGVAGITAADTLEKLGYQNVTVFESNTEVGGKVCTFIYDDRPYELGAMVIPTSYKTILGMAKEHEIPLRRVPNAFIVTEII